MTGSNVFDIVAVVLLAWSGYRGFSKGIISALASLTALLLGIWGAIKFSQLTAFYLSDLIKVDEKLMSIIAFAVTFIGIVIGIHFFAKLIERLVKAVALGFVNKIFGAIFGVLKIAFIISVVLFFVNAINTKTGFLSLKFKEYSILYQPIEKFAPSIFKYLDVEDNKLNLQTDTKSN